MNNSYNAFGNITIIHWIYVIDSYKPAPGVKMIGSKKKLQVKERMEPLVNDGFAGDATKRTLSYLQKKWAKVRRVMTR